MNEETCTACAGPIPSFTYDGVDYWGCPRRQVSAFAIMALDLFRHYEAGHLWAGGGLADQPYRYLQAMITVGAEVDAIEAEASAKAPPTTPGGQPSYESLRRGRR